MSNAIDCDFSVQGSGPALFLTHGIGAAKNAWRFMISELSKYFTVVTYDLRGHGNSPVTNKNFTLDDKNSHDGIHVSKGEWAFFNFEQLLKL